MLCASSLSVCVLWEGIQDFLLVHFCSKVYTNRTRELVPSSCPACFERHVRRKGGRIPSPLTPKADICPFWFDFSGIKSNVIKGS